MALVDLLLAFASSSDRHRLDFTPNSRYRVTSQCLTNGLGLPSVLPAKEEDSLGGASPI